MKSKARKSVIGFDMDGVIIDHTKNKLMLAQKFGFKITKNQTPSDTMHNIIPGDTWDEMQKILFDDPRVALTPKLMPGARYTLNKLVTHGVPFYLISRRQNPVIAIKLLEKHELWPKYFNDKNTFFVRSKEDKNKKSRELKITHYFDDQESVLSKLTSVNNKYLFDHLRVSLNSKYKNIASWKEIAKILI